MTSFVEFAWRVALAVGIPFVILVTTVSPLRGEMCSAIVSVSDEGGIEDLATLQAQTFAAFASACQKPVSNQQSCMFESLPATPMNFKFVLGPVRAPFKMRFALKAERDSMVALADNKTHESIFAQIGIGGYSNTKATINACFDIDCPHPIKNYLEKDLTNATVYRPFWFEYNGGIVTFGKGGRQESFLKWDAGAHHGRIPYEVYIGISTWQEVSGSWIFYDFCD